MADAYDPSEIEKKWRQKWADAGIYAAREDADKSKAYILDMFPYPSGEGLHVGHPKGYIATDIYSRYKRMQGHSVLHPMGWDAFGLPAENYALANKVHPRVAVEKNIARFKEQLEKIGFDYDWSREINTTDPAYYKWTQWIFLKLFEKGLAYQSNEPINWCPSCMTGLSNEDLDDGKCERCGSAVEKKKIRQWVLKITDYAERLLTDLELLPKWPEHIKESQRNWIGKSEGAEINFTITGKNKYVILHGFTSRPNRPRFLWLKSELEKQGHEVIIVTLPNPDAPTEEGWVSAALAATDYDENTVLCGFSLGAVTAMKVVEKLEQPIKGLVLAGGFVDRGFKIKPRNFDPDFTWRFDAKKIRHNANFITVLHDINDDHISTQQKENLESMLGIKAELVESEKPHFKGETEPTVLRALSPRITVFTTRPDTLFGATYMVLAPEHPLLTQLITDNKQLTIENTEDVLSYMEVSQNKTEIERTAEGKEKTGVELKGVKAVNPANQEEIPIYVADYVLGHYGTGAIMAVPAHDERDYAFAKKFNVPVRPVIFKQLSNSRSFVMGVDEGDIKKLGATIIEKTDSGFFKIEVPLDRLEEYKAFIRERMRPHFWNEFSTPSGFYFIFKHKDGRLEEFELNQSTNDKIDAYGMTFNDKPERDVPQNVYEWLADNDFYRDLLIHHEPGVLVNSGEFDGMPSEEAKKKITEFVGGKLTVQYKLRDWVFSRQRYWGEPIPIIHCEKCGAVAVPEKDLPVLLPDVERYEPSGTGESPLANISSFVDTVCPKCGGPGKRETNTMPQWAGSSWYYIAYCVSESIKSQVSSIKSLQDKEVQEKLAYWLLVDMYVGGAEHATRHLIYARFWHKFLQDIGVVSTPEPFDALHSVGLIIAEDGRKMSKRFGNVINPDAIVERHGADTLRVYEMFMGPFENAIAWNTQSMIGSRRFLERIWKLAQQTTNNEQRTMDEPLMHRTIKKVGEDIEAFKFNTAIAQMMIVLNVAEKEGISKEQWRNFLRLLAPFAPHIAEELWAQAGGPFSVHTAAWPAYDPAKIAENIITVAVQLNGKLRATMEASKDASKEELEEAAKKTLGERLLGLTILRTVVVPGRLVNIVVDPGKGL